MQKDGDGRLKGTTLGMEKLYKHLFKSDLPGTVDTTLTQPIKHPLLLFFPGAHRALADVRAMKAIFTHLNCLDDVEIRSPNQQLMLWKSQKMAYKRTTSLVASLGKPSITTSSEEAGLLGVHIRISLGSVTARPVTKMPSLQC